MAFENETASSSGASPTLSADIQARKAPHDEHPRSSTAPSHGSYQARKRGRTLIPYLSCLSSYEHTTCPSLSIFFRSTLHASSILREQIIYTPHQSLIQRISNSVSATSHHHGRSQESRQRRKARRSEGQGYLQGQGCGGEDAVGPACLVLSSTMLRLSRATAHSTAHSIVHSTTFRYIAQPLVPTQLALLSFAVRRSSSGLVRSLVPEILCQKPRVRSPLSEAPCREQQS